MKMSLALRLAEKTLRDQAPAILTGFGVGGVVTTSALAIRATYRATHRLESESPYLTNREVVEKVWDLYIPVGISGALTIGCIIAATRVSSKRAAAAYSILRVSEKAYEEYREKVVEKLGENKESAIRDEIAKDHIHRNPPSETIVIESGKVLCLELFSGRYFTCDMETLKRATNTINARLITELSVPVYDFYYLIGLDYTTHSGKMGWVSGKLLELHITTELTKDDKPCIAFDYNYVEPI